MRLTLRRHREGAGLTMAECAAAVGVAVPSYCNWETGKTLPTADKLPAIAALFGCTIDALYGHDAPDNTILPTDGGERHGA